MGWGTRFIVQVVKQDVIEGKEKKKGGINFFFLFNNNNNNNDNDNDNDNNVDIKCYYQSHIWKGNISLEIYLPAYGF